LLFLITIAPRRLCAQSPICVGVSTALLCHGLCTPLASHGRSQLCNIHGRRLRMHEVTTQDSQLPSRAIKGNARSSPFVSSQHHLLRIDSLPLLLLLRTFSTGNEIKKVSDYCTMGLWYSNTTQQAADVRCSNVFYAFYFSTCSLIRSCIPHFP
jgi:hypothetical protein